MNENINIENLDEDELVKLIGEEYKKCKDPVYFYNTYWRMADGSKPKPITHDQYNSIVNYSSRFTRKKSGNNTFNFMNIPDNI